MNEEQEKIFDEPPFPFYQRERAIIRGWIERILSASTPPAAETPMSERPDRPHYMRRIGGPLDKHCNHNDSLPSFEEIQKQMKGPEAQSVVSQWTNEEPPAAEDVDGKLWSAVRSLLALGATIQQDYVAGNHKTYEHFSRHLDITAASESKKLQPLLASVTRGRLTDSELEAEVEKVLEMTLPLHNPRVGYLVLARAVRDACGGGGVKLPEKKMPDELPYGDDLYNAGWNECIEQVRSLNNLPGTEGEEGK